MQIKRLWMIGLLSFALCGCAGAPHIIGYDIIKPPLEPPNLGKVYILPFDDERPQEEHEGAKGRLLSFSSKDEHFSQPVPVAIREVLQEELANAGFSIVEEEKDSNYQILGSVKHFQAVSSPAKITFLPYLGSVSTLWAKDEFTVALSLDIKMTETAGGNVLIDKTFNVCEDLKLPTGLLNLARYSRGFNYKVKLLDEALRDVIGQIRDEAVAKVK